MSQYYVLFRRMQLLKFEYHIELVSFLNPSFRQPSLLEATDVDLKSSIFLRFLFHVPPSSAASRMNEVRHYNNGSCFTWLRS